MKPDRIKSLIKMAVHGGTPDNEALAAMRRLGQAIDASPAGFDAVFSASAPAARPLTFNSSRSQIDELETKLAIKDSTINRLEKEVERLMGEVGSLKADNEAIRLASIDRMGRVRADGTMPWDEYALRVKRILGEAWGNALAEQTDLTTLEINRMRQVGVATKEAVEALSTLKKPAPDLSELFWSPEEIRIIRKLAKTVDNEEELAKAATIEITKTVRERVITSGHIRKLIVDSRNRNGVFRQKGYGVTAIKIGALNNNDKKSIKERVPKFPWELFPKVELALAKDFLGGNGNKRQPVSWWVRYIEQQTNRKITEGQIKQRLHNAPPPSRITETLVTEGPTSWAELWHLGSKLDGGARAWNHKLWRAIGKEARAVGDDLSDLSESAVNQLRKLAREGMSERERAIDMLNRNGGYMTRGDFRENALMEFGTIFQSVGRVADLRRTKIVEVLGPDKKPFDIGTTHSDDDIVILSARRDEVMGKI